MKLYRVMFFMLLLLFSLDGCGQTDQLQYEDPQLWYDDVHTTGSKQYDVFYVLPTCVWDRVDAKGDTLHYADPWSAADRKAMLPSYELAEKIFGEEANFYAPYYRHLTLQSWRSDSLVEARFPFAFEDVRNAFDYYMEHINEGHPFVLAGFSQGAKAVVELLKILTPEQYRRMVAAYVIGYKVTASDTLNYAQIKPAMGAKDTGVTICYNSVADTGAVCEVLSPSAICINPLTWTTSDTPAPLNDSVEIHVDKDYHVLIVEGFDPEQYYHNSLSFLFKKGNYHLQELFLYRNYLSENVKARFQAYSLKQ